MPVEPASGPVRRRQALSQRRPLFLLASVLAIGVAAWVVGPRLLAWNAERRAASAFETAADCLKLGADTKDADLRQRAIDAGMRGDAWPAQCAQPLAELLAAARAAHLSRDRCDGACCVDDSRCVSLTEFEVLAGEVKTQVGDGRFVDSAARGIVDAAESLGWSPPTATPALPSVAHLTAADLPPLTKLALDRVALIRAGRAPWWLMIQENRRAATLCELASTDATARCQGLDPPIPAKSALYMIDGGLSDAPRVFSLKDASRVLYTPTGQVVAELSQETVGVSMLKSDVVVAVTREEESFGLFVAGEKRLSVGATSEPLLYGGYLFAQNEAELGIFSIDAASRTDSVKLASSARVTMRGCVGANVTAVRVRDDEGRTDVLLTNREGIWTTQSLPADVRPRTMSCHGSEVHFTWMPPPHGTRHRVTNVVCAASGCSERKGELELQRHGPRSRFFVASLGADVAVIWRSHLGDVRARIGPPDALRERFSIAVLEDAEHGGLSWDDTHLRVLSAERAAVILIQSADGVHALQIDGQGVRPMLPPKGL